MMSAELVVIEEPRPVPGGWDHHAYVLRGHIERGAFVALPSSRITVMQFSESKTPPWASPMEARAVMAATLAHLKSRMLLPRDTAAEAPDDPGVGA